VKYRQLRAEKADRTAFTAELRQYRKRLLNWTKAHPIDRWLSLSTLANPAFPVVYRFSSVVDAHIWSTFAAFFIIVNDMLPDDESDQFSSGNLAKDIILSIESLLGSALGRLLILFPLTVGVRHLTGAGASKERTWALDILRDMGQHDFDLAAGLVDVAVAKHVRSQGFVDSHSSPTTTLESRIVELL